MLAAALVVADRLGDATPAASAKAALVHGMSVVLLVTAAIALLSAVLTAACCRAASGPRTRRSSGQRSMTHPALDSASHGSRRG